MKKLRISVLILLVFMFVFSGCKNSDAIKIDNQTWIMTNVQSMSSGGQVVAYGREGSSALDSAAFVELECKAGSNVLTLTDKTNSKRYTGSYIVTANSPESTIYEVKIENTKGTAVCALTAYLDGSNNPTLIINFGEYTLNFLSLN